VSTGVHNIAFLVSPDHFRPYDLFFTDDYHKGLQVLVSCRQLKGTTSTLMTIQQMGISKIYYTLTALQTPGP